MPRKSPPPKPSKIPEEIKQAAIADFASGLGRISVSNAWEITEGQARLLQEKHRAEIQEQRIALSRACIQVASHGVAIISAKMADPEEMANTPLRDVAMTVQKLVDAGVTAADGHKPDIRIDFGSLRTARDELMRRDELQKEMRKAREAEVV